MVLHYGQGRWFVIDSCLSPDSKVPVALEYFESLGVDAATQVTGLLISHWHRDHIDGALRIVCSCEKAVVQAPAALLDREALNLACLYRRDPFNDTDKEIREFREIVTYLAKRNQQERYRLVGARHLFFDDHTVGVRLVALSPSEVAMTQAIEQIRELKPEGGDKRRRLVAPASENLNAVALHFSFGKFSAVLGADLEESGNQKTGWSAIINANICSELSLAKASVYKVAHHGSISGHHQGVWDKMLTPLPLAMTTSHANSRLPKESDVQRITQLASSFIVTRNPTPKSKTRRDPLTDRILRRTNSRCVINERMGHVQVRANLDGTFSVAMNPVCAAYRQVDAARPSNEF